MSSQSRKSISWFTRLGNALRPRHRSAISGQKRRGLRFESLETRSLLSAAVPAAISGVVYRDPTGAGVIGNYTRVANATLNLFRDGGDGVFEGNGAGDDKLVQNTTSDPNGNYKFNNLSAGTYFVQESGASGLVIPQGVQTVVIGNSDLQGVTNTTIDSFASTSQYVSGASHAFKTGSSSLPASEAIGGHRNMNVQLTSPWGAVSMGANYDFNGLMDFSANSASTGNFWINWDGSGNAAKLNPTGLGQVDLTSNGTSTGIMLTLGADHDQGSVALKVYTDAGDWSSASIPIDNTGDGSLGTSHYVPFSSFIAGPGAGAADFAKVGAIQLSINGVSAIDGQVGPLTVVGPKTYSGTNFVNVARADLVLQKTAAPSPVTPGSQITYTLTVTNNGPSTATGVSIVDTLPAAVYFTTASGHTSGSISGQAVTLNVANLAAGASETVTMVVIVRPTATAGTITNTATVGGNEPDPNLANNTATANTQITVPTIKVDYTDLAIVKSAAPNPVNVGSMLTYTLVVTNNSLIPATGVTIVDTIPTGFGFYSASGHNSATMSGNTLTFYMNNLAPQASETLTIVGMVTTAAASTITNTATVSSIEPDKNLVDNTSSVTTTVNTPVQWWKYSLISW